MLKQLTVIQLVRYIFCVSHFGNAPRRLREVEKISPQIDIVAYDDEDKSIDSLPIQIVKYDNLTELRLNEIIADLKNKFPMVTEFDKATDKDFLPPQVKSLGSHFGINYQYEPPSEDEIEKYQQKYPQWLDNVREFFCSLPAELEVPYRIKEISISISNIGNVPAENVLVEFSLVSGLVFKPPGDGKLEMKRSTSRILPRPPRAPEGKWIERRTAFSSMINELGKMREFDPFHPSTLGRFPGIAPIQPSRDKNAFYWKPHRPTEDEDSWTFECDEFRHQTKSEDFDLSLWVPPEMDIENAALKCRVSAKNLVQPKEYILPIVITYIQGDITEEIENSLDSFDS